MQEKIQTTQNQVHKITNINKDHACNEYYSVEDAVAKRKIQRATSRSTLITSDIG
jgi:hypothetical protein